MDDLYDNTVKYELLAPAKNYLFAKNAIYCGADAVYMASESFGLRKGLGNSLDEIKKTVRFAHKYWAKTYVTVNSLLFGKDELIKAQSLINSLYEIGVDGIIIQDMGIFELDLPPIPISLSTTVCCDSVEKIQFYEKLGVDRVILPRELTLEQIKDISSKTKVNLEVFVHGLLCAGVSGRCHLQYAKNLKSGNPATTSARGVCDLNCMHHYDLVDNSGNKILENERLLNLRFLNLSDNLEELIDAGVTSFKIEGRQKELDYLKNTVLLYRRKLDEILIRRNLKAASSGMVDSRLIPRLDNTFNKGFTDFFLHGKKKEMYSNIDIVGEFVGNVSLKSDDTFVLDSIKTLYVGDKLRFRDSEGNVSKICITKVSKNKYSFASDTKLVEGTSLYRYLSPHKTRKVILSGVSRYIPVSIQMKKQGTNLSVSAFDSDDTLASIEMENVPFVEENDSLWIDKELSGFSEFKTISLLKSEDFALSFEYMNLLKKQLFNSLRKERAKKFRRKTVKINKEKLNYPLTMLDSNSNVVNELAESFYKKHGVESIAKSVELSSDLSGEKIFIAKYCIKNELGLCNKNSTNSEFNKYEEPFFIIDKLQNRYRVEFDCQKCEMYFIY